MSMATNLSTERRRIALQPPGNCPEAAAQSDPATDFLTLDHVQVPVTLDHCNTPVVDNPNVALGV
jgi:hypothetical protein